MLKYFALVLLTENCVIVTLPDLFLKEGIQTEALLPVLIQIRAIKMLFFRLSVVFYLWYLYSSFLVSAKDDLRGLFLL